MTQEYIKTETMRLKISGQAPGEPQSGRDLIRAAAVSHTTSVAKPYERDFSELLESVYDTVIITDMRGRVLRVNGRSLEHFGYGKEEFANLNIVNVIPGADDQILKTVHETLTSDRRIFIEGSCLKRDGGVFPAEITANLLHLHEREQLCFFIRSIERRVKVEEALRQAQRELVETAHHAGMAEIATGVLHDVGNILNSVNVSCELVLKSLKESALEALARVNGQVRQAGDLATFVTNDPRGRRLGEIYQEIGHVLDAERLTMQTEAENLKGKIKLIREVISTQQNYAKAGVYEEESDLAKLVEDALAILANSIEKDKLIIIKEFEPVPALMVQRSKFVHILLNVIKNARDALIKVADRPRQITIRVAQDGIQATVGITDNGEGIAPSILDKIFTHGFTTKDSGHGFGLHSCANLMSELGGKIHVRSPGPGRGATFLLALPLRKGETQGGAPHE